MKTSPLKVFVHVPKTAGSTVNGYLKKSDGVGLTHVEGWIDDNTKLKQELKRLDWISGHVTFPQFRSKLSNSTFRRLDFFATLRNPKSQLMSHYNWLIEIYNKGENFYNTHPDKIKEISENIRKCGNGKASDVVEQILAAPGLFLNQQTRLVFGEVPADMTEISILNRLSVYNLVCVENLLPVFVSKVSGVNYDDSYRENESRYHFDTRIFDDIEMSEFIEKHHSADLALYKTVAKYGIIERR